MKRVCIAAALLAVLVAAVLLSLPIFGREMPWARFVNAEAATFSLEGSLRHYLEVHPTEAPPPIAKLAAWTPDVGRNLSFKDSRNPRVLIQFVDAHEATGGAMVYAADRAIENPKTGEMVRMVVDLEFGDPAVPEEWYQQMLEVP